MPTLDPFRNRQTSKPDKILTVEIDKTRGTPFWLNFQYQFYAVGQGLFASGELFRPSDGDSFTWVYDSGTSSKSSVLQREVSYLLGNVKKGDLDLVCVSHFDEDHIRGIEQLLSTRKVRVLIMPYYPLVSRIAIALRSGEIESSYLDFLIDPAGHMSRIAGEELRVVFVSGGDDPSARVPGQAEDPEPLETPLELSTPPPLRDSQVTREDLRGIGPNSENMPDPKLVGHQGVFKVGAVWEFMFYNTHVPIHTLRRLHARVVDILRHRRRADQTYDGPTMFRELKDAYGRRFGRTAKDRNKVSLVAYAGPRCRNDDYEASLFGAVHPVAFDGTSWITGRRGDDSRSSCAKVGIGYFGDLSLTGNSIVSGIRRHLGKRRWSGIEVVQIPHHGSSHSWPMGTATQFHHHVSVISAARVSPHGHPGQDVLDDLSSHGVVLVNEYQRAILGGEVHGYT